MTHDIAVQLIPSDNCQAKKRTKNGTSLHFVIYLYRQNKICSNQIYGFVVNFLTPIQCAWYLQFPTQNPKETNGTRKMCAWRKRNICKSIFNAYKETHTCIWRRQFCTKGNICLDLLEIINKEDIFAHIHRRKWQSHNGKTAINHSWVAQKLPRIRFSFVLITVSWFFVSFCLFFMTHSQPIRKCMRARAEIFALSFFCAFSLSLAAL